MPNLKKYIGDGVYINFAEGQVIITTENGIDVINIIFLEKEVSVSLIEYIKELIDSGQF